MMDEKGDVASILLALRKPSASDLSSELSSESAESSTQSPRAAGSLPSPMSVMDEPLWKKRTKKKRRVRADKAVAATLSIPSKTSVSLVLSKDSVRDLIDESPIRSPSRLGLVAFPGETLSSTSRHHDVVRMPQIGKTEKPRFRPASSQIVRVAPRPPAVVRMPTPPQRQGFAAVNRQCAAAA